MIDMAEIKQTASSNVARSEGGFVRAIGLFDGTMIVVGSMIGSGILLWLPIFPGRRDPRAGCLPRGSLRGCSRFRRRFPLGSWRRYSRMPGAIYLFARSVLAAVGLSLWLDIISGDPDGHDRGGGYWICAVPGSAGTGDLAADVGGASAGDILEIRDQFVGAATGGGADDNFFDVFEYAGSAAGEDHSEYFYQREDAFAAGIDFSLRVCGA